MEIESKLFKFKWNKINIEIHTSKQTVEELKKEIFNQTKVHPDRQKLILKGKSLNNSDLLSEIPTGSLITLIGTADTDVVVSNKDNKVIFVEDLSKEEKMKLLKEKGEEELFGLANLGNTCYFNSLVQAFGRVERLREELIKLSKNSSSYSENTNNNNNLNYNDNSDGLVLFAKELGSVYDRIVNTTERIVPTKLVSILRSLNPSFADNSKGYYQQQDADECMIFMLNALKRALKLKKEDDNFADNLIDELFGISLDISLTNIEENSEVKKNKETALKLVCYIDDKTNELVNGLKNSLEENVELFSDKLSRNSFFVKKQLISRLPPFLNIQFMRFFWKEANDDMFGSKAGKAKILKSVMFSKIIDVYDLCTPDVQEILKLGRDIEGKMLKEDKTYRTDLAFQKKGENMIPTGRYQLIAVVTHQGRSSEEGHYIGWTHKKEEKWTKFDDDIVTPQKNSDILELKGGGDWHMAYICIYQALEVPFQEV